ncbi:hypothetical protein APV28_5031 [Comamonas testosteroni]|nr:hypothetical protein APV28_5031 [Comamonas testosteroni]
MDRKYVGFNNLRTRYLGVYGTWQDQSCLYADAVLQGADYAATCAPPATQHRPAPRAAAGWLLWRRANPLL